MKQIFNLDKGMTQAISHFSRHDDASVEKTATGYKYLGSDNITAEKKIKRFYWRTILALVSAALIIFWMTFSAGETPT